jgi:hypothetical protein
MNPINTFKIIYLVDYLLVTSDLLWFADWKFLAICIAHLFHACYLPRPTPSISYHYDILVSCSCNKPVL